MAKKPVMPGELKNLLNGVNKKEEEARIEEQAEKTAKTHTTVRDAEKPAKVEKKAEKEEGRGEAAPKSDAEKTSIDRIIEYAQEYKESDIEMATVVLSDDMKQMLDKLRTSLPVKTPFKYLLSGIIKEYMTIHRKEIADLIMKF